MSKHKTQTLSISTLVKTVTIKLLLFNDLPSYLFGLTAPYDRLSTILSTNSRCCNKSKPFSLSVKPGAGYNLHPAQ